MNQQHFGDPLARGARPEEARVADLRGVAHEQVAGGDQREEVRKPGIADTRGRVGAGIL